MSEREARAINNDSAALPVGQRDRGIAAIRLETLALVKRGVQ
jgi:hypothetical protein